MQKMREKEAIEWLKAISATQKESVHTISLLNRKEALHMAIQALEGIQQYRAIGIASPEELEQDLLLYKADRELVKLYTAIGTVEGCREAVERMKPKKPIEQAKAKDGEKFVGMVGRCPACGNLVDWTNLCCDECLQRLDWE